jgi:hypothetical protein
MSTPAHIISGAYLGVVAAHVAPSETGYIYTALVSAGALDLDHIFYFIRDWKYYKKNGFVGKMHHARSVFHELIGFTLMGAIMFFLSFTNLKLALVLGIPAMIHIAEDIIMGTSMPLAPFDKTEISVMTKDMRIRATIDVLVIIIFAFLWIQYLNAA